MMCDEMKIIKKNYPRILIINRLKEMGKKITARPGQFWKVGAAVFCPNIDKHTSSRRSRQSLEPVKIDLTKIVPATLHRGNVAS